MQYESRSLRVHTKDKVIQTRSHERNTITSRKRRFVMRKACTTSARGSFLDCRKMLQKLDLVTCPRTSILMNFYMETNKTCTPRQIYVDNLALRFLSCAPGLDRSSITLQQFFLRIDLRDRYDCLRSQQFYLNPDTRIKGFRIYWWLYTEVLYFEKPSRSLKIPETCLVRISELVETLQLPNILSKRWG